MLYTHNQRLLPPIQTEEFLPPISRWTSMAGVFLVGTVSTGGALASWIKYPVTVKAPATVRPQGDIRLVQPEMNGTVKSILVKENQAVKKGDIIARLDDTELNIQAGQLRNNIQQTNSQLTQLNAQIINLETQIDAEKRVIERNVAAAEADLVRNQREYEDRRIETQSELLAAQANLEKARAGLQKFEADLQFAIEDRERYRELAAEGAISKREYDKRKLGVEQARAALAAEKKVVDIARANLEKARAVLNPTNALVAIATERIAQASAQGQSNIAAFVREKNALMQRKIEMYNQVQQSQKELQKNRLQAQSSVIRATSDGIILKLNLRNSNQVVRPSEPIAEIVPQDAPLMIKARVPVSEIKKVGVNQSVQLRVDSCPYPDFGTLKGKVVAVSPDTITSVNTASGGVTPAMSYFEATIKPENSSFGNGIRTCQLQVGMDAQAQIISKQETALQFMLRKARLITDL